jgi:hypothetical protein
MLQDHLGTKYEIKSTFKSNIPVANVVEVLWKLGNDLKSDILLL